MTRRASTLFTELPEDVLIEILSGLPVRELANFSTVTSTLNSLASDHPTWRNMLDEEKANVLRRQSKLSYKMIFRDHPQARLPKFLTVDLPGKNYVVQEVLAGGFDDPVSKILRGETEDVVSSFQRRQEEDHLTEEEVNAISNVNQLLHSDSLDSDARSALESEPVRAFIASGQLSVEQAIKLNPLGLSSLENRLVQAFIVSSQLSMEQAIKLDINSLCNLESEDVRAFIASGQLSMEQAINLDVCSRCNLESEDVRASIESGKLSMEDAIALDPYQLSKIRNGPGPF